MGVFKWGKRAAGALFVVGLVGFLVFGRDVGSYARTAAQSAREAVKGEVPIEFEVERARNMVESLVSDVRDCMHVIAEQQVDVEHMERDLDEREAALVEQRGEILARRSELETDREHFVHAGESYSRSAIERDLEIRFDRYKAAEETLSRDRDVLSARRAALRANEDKLDGMLAAKQELEVQVEQLEARLKTLAAAETVSDLEFDDTQLGRAKSLIGELNKQLDVRERLLDSEGRFTGLIPVDPQHGADGRRVTSEIDAHFGVATDSEQPEL